MRPSRGVLVFIHDIFDAQINDTIMKYLFSLVLTSVFLISCTTSHSQEEKTVEKSFEGIQSINLNTASGDCKISKGDGDAVLVRVIYTYDDDQYTPKMEKNGSSLKLEEKFHANNVRGNSEWELFVPDGLQIGYNTGSGDLIVSDLRGDINFNSGSGDGHTEDFEGELKFNTGSGDFYFKDIQGDLKANSGSGDFHISDCKLTAEANTGSGDIGLTDSKGGYKLNTGSGDVEAAGLILSEKGSFNTGSGDVEVRLDAALQDDISANSGSGDAVVDFNGHPIEGVVVMTCKKKGGSIKAPFAFDKEEEIDRNGETFLKKTARLGTKDIRIEVGTGTGTAEIRK
jgi:hypothetical protein